MKNIYVSAIIDNEKHYLQTMYPISWSPFISGALKFTSIPEARLNMNCLYKNLFTDNFTLDTLYTVNFVIVENAVITEEIPYILKED